jgi:hypothetical protein
MGFIQQNGVFTIKSAFPTNIVVKGNPFRWVRNRIGTVRWILAKDLKLAEHELKTLEERKMFYVGELLALQELCELSNDQFVAMLKEVA